MDKVKKFLENYVQWLALALGVGFLGYTVYYYVLQKPVSVPSVGNATNVEPGDVAPLIHDGPAKDLGGMINSKVSVEIKPPPADLVARATAGFQPNPSDPTVLAVLPHTYVPLGPIPQMEQDANAATADHGKQPVTSLPAVPAIVDLKVATGHSNVPAPVVLGPNGQPAAPSANGQAALAVDKNWQTVEGTIPVSALSKAFDDAKIPPNFRPTCILRVELLREERGADGTWSAPTTMPSLDINQMKDLPDNNAPVVAQNDYRTWAEGNVPLICQPPFYQVLQGDVWYEPGTPNPNQINNVVIDSGFNPQDPGSYKGDPNLLTPKERELYDAWLKRQAAKDAARARSSQNRNQTPAIPEGPGGEPGAPSPNGGGGGSGGSSRGGRRGLAADPQRGGPGDLLMPPALPPVPGGEPGFQPMQPQGGTANTSASAATLPQGSFDPAQQPDIKVWAHDATAQSGHTYRYMLKYVISNPVAHTSNLCNPQSLAQQFSIESADSVWTDPVNVESDTSFYAVQVKGHGIEFQIFKWKNGVWQMQDVTAGPGDVIGSVDTTATKTDFTTGWTLVDVRDDPHDEDNKTILLVSDNGAVKKKELTFDQRSSEYHRLYGEANKAKTAAAGSTPGGPNG